MEEKFSYFDKIFADVRRNAIDSVNALEERQINLEKSI
jgi:hypothetical protein